MTEEKLARFQFLDNYVKSKHWSEYYGPQMPVLHHTEPDGTRKLTETTSVMEVDEDYSKRIDLSIFSDLNAKYYLKHFSSGAEIEKVVVSIVKDEHYDLNHTKWREYKAAHDKLVDQYNEDILIYNEWKKLNQVSKLESALAAAEALLREHGRR